jgi:membrane protein YdbS with pleckstrin-like domain
MSREPDERDPYAWVPKAINRYRWLNVGIAFVGGVQIYIMFVAMQAQEYGWVTMSGTMLALLAVIMHLNTCNIKRLRRVYRGLRYGDP